MPPCFSVTEQRQTATKRMVLCCGCVGLSFLALVGFGLVPRTQASENILPNHQVSATPTKIQPKLVASYGKLPLSFEANQGQTDARVRFLARGGGGATHDPGTPAGTYPLTVTGSTGSGSSAVSHSARLTVS